MIKIGSHPTHRPRRMRREKFLRALMAETTLLPQNLIQPLFVVDEPSAVQKIDAMPGINRLGETELLHFCESLLNLGIINVALFPHISQSLKAADGREAKNPNGLIQRRTRAVKDRFPELGVICDVALDPYTLSGQDGLTDENQRILNDETIEVLVEQAIVHAGSGVDLVAPSDMMDGRIGAIREALDRAGFYDVGILAYSAKYASSFYGPFREAVGSASNLGKADKKTYQMDPANTAEALREVGLDIEQGADMVMIKPAGPYMDIIARVKEAFNFPTAAYQVSGEYSALKLSVEAGVLGEEVIYESLLGLRRAGCDCILTYFAHQVGEMLNNN